MPKSKRETDVVLSKVKKKTRDWKKNLVDEVRQCVEQYERVIVLNCDNASTILGRLRMEMRRDSRLFFGKNRVLAVALGRHDADEAGRGLHALNRCLTGQCALLFTRRSVDQVLQCLTKLSGQGFARTGQLADRDVILPVGSLTQFSFAQEPLLRKWGLPTKLDKGVIILINDYTVCRSGEMLTREQCRLLKMLDVKMAHSMATIAGHWSRGTGLCRIIENSTVEQDMEQ